MSLAHAPGAKPLVCIGLNSIWRLIGRRVGWGGSNKKSVLSFITSCKAVMPLAEEVCTPTPRGIDFFFQSLKRERGRGEESAPISPPPLPLPGRIRCSGYEVKKICPVRFVSFPAAVSITHQPLGGRGVYSLKLLSVGK